MEQAKGKKLQSQVQWRLQNKCRWRKGHVERSLEIKVGFEWWHAISGGIGRVRQLVSDALGRHAAHFWRVANPVEKRALGTVGCVMACGRQHGPRDSGEVLVMSRQRRGFNSIHIDTHTGPAP
ncbi:hypothetical protein CDD81_3723 [Ophiocordyceps australis]|uniref:Uncharacterized protein n=1 Tax=Ophiocordyceps australis TaxID=1399860 RepID=A0A2C5XPC2_9HYPO|nr:hypothetical protein CDD81_3723 [Ophiocordyceps australis]